LNKFSLTTTTSSIASQAAAMLNGGGQLKWHVTTNSILHSNTNYIIELDRELLIAIIGMEKKTDGITELKHLCVHPRYRKQGLGRKMLEKGIEQSKTGFVYGIVRSDNLSNIRNNIRVGMLPALTLPKANYSLIVFARRTKGEQSNRAAK